MNMIKMKGEISGNGNISMESNDCAHVAVFTVIRAVHKCL